ncbi:MAG TPA: BON domain-containing protein [Nannocystaceae bacterium]|nr:BON domain-containing protein [Nannocystaceae bacterium]
MGSDDDWETPPGFGQTLGAPELAPGSLARAARSADEHAVQTDALILEDVTRVLEDSVEDTDDVAATVEGGEVTLDGVAADLTAVQAIEALVERVAGVKRVHSRLRVA